MNQRFRFATFFFFCFTLSAVAQNADINLLKGINKNETWFKNNYLELCASSTSIISIAAPATVLAHGFITKDKKLQRDGFFMTGGLIVSGIVIYSVKRIVNRKRPFETYSFIVKRDDESGGKSFPSGHTNSAFYTATALSLQYKKWYVTAPAFVFAGSVAWARMYQGVHYPSDVLVGAIIGSGTALLSDWINKKTAKRQHKPITVE